MKLLTASININAKLENILPYFMQKEKAYQWLNIWSTKFELLEGNWGEIGFKVKVTSPFGPSWEHEFIDFDKDSNKAVFTLKGFLNGEEHFEFIEKSESTLIQDIVKYEYGGPSWLKPVWILIGKPFAKWDMFYHLKLLKDSVEASIR